MGRMTNEQLGTKLDTLIDVLTKQALPAPAAPVAAVADSEAPAIEVSEGYLSKMTEKASNHATSKGCEVVLYARKNQRGETKLAYALRERFDALTDKGLIGAVGTFQP